MRKIAFAMQLGASVGFLILIGTVWSSSTSGLPMHCRASIFKIISAQWLRITLKWAGKRRETYCLGSRTPVLGLCFCRPHWGLVHTFLCADIPTSGTWKMRVRLSFPEFALAPFLILSPFLWPQHQSDHFVSFCTSFPLALLLEVIWNLSKESALSTVPRKGQINQPNGSVEPVLLARPKRAHPQ